MLENDIVVLDNILPIAEHQTIHDSLLGFDFPWYFYDHVVNKNESEFTHTQFVHIFYNNFNINSELFSLISPILKVLNPASLIRIKANLNLYNPNRVAFPYHVDVDFKNSTTALYYVNSNDGCTLFKNGKSIESVANRLVIFNSQILHTGTNTQNAKARCVINFNYF